MRAPTQGLRASDPLAPPEETAHEETCKGRRRDVSAELQPFAISHTVSQVKFSWTRLSLQELYFLPTFYFVSVWGQCSGEHWGSSVPGVSLLQLLLSV